MATIEDKYNRYMENVKRANDKYKTNNRELVKERVRSYYHKCLANNDEYKAKKQAYNKQRYEMKKSQSIN